MKTILFVTGFVVISALCHSQSKDEQTVRKMLQSQTIAWNKGHLKGFMHGYWQSDSLQFIGKSGITYGWNETLDNYIEHYPDTAAMGKLVFNIFEIKQLSANYQFVTGKWQLIRTAGDLDGYFTLLIKKINSQWRIIADHSS